MAEPVFYQCPKCGLTGPREIMAERTGQLACYSCLFLWRVTCWVLRVVDLPRGKTFLAHLPCKGLGG